MLPPTPESPEKCKHEFYEDITIQSLPILLCRKCHIVGGPTDKCYACKKQPCTQSTTSCFMPASKWESPSEKLRQELEDFIEERYEKGIMTPCDPDAIDFIFSRTVSKEVLQDIVAEIKTMRKDEDSWIGHELTTDKEINSQIARKKGFNQALSDVAALVARKLEE